MLSHEFVCLLPYEIYSLVYQIQPSKLRCRKSLVLREKWSPMSTDNGSMSIVNWWYDMGLFEHGIPPNSSGISPPCSMAILGYTPNFRHTHGPYHGTAGAAAEVRCRPVTTKNKGDGRWWALGWELNMHLLKFYQLVFFFPLQWLVLSPHAINAWLSSVGCYSPIFSSLLFSSPTLLTSAFPSVHIDVGSLTSKLPSTMCFQIPHMCICGSIFLMGLITTCPQIIPNLELFIYVSFTKGWSQAEG